MTRGIYRIATEQETLYVGQSRDVEDRLKGHKSSLSSGRHANSYLLRVYKKDPEAISVWELVEEVAEGDLHAREAFWIEKLSARCNLVIPEFDGWTFADETKKKMSKIKKGKKQSAGHVQKRIASTTATRKANGSYRVISDETRKKISEAGKGRKQSPESIEKTRRANLGRTISTETRRKISESVKRTFSDPEWKEQQRQRVIEGMRKPGVSEKISAGLRGKPSWNKGIPRTKEVKEALSRDWAKRPFLECPHCGGQYRLLASHMTKKHKDLRDED